MGMNRNSKLARLVIPERGPVRQRKSGAGAHGDRRTARLRTREAQERAAIRDQSR
jgi:hypothetical protein